jgi:nitrite reductase/ring-hydroxylating ferredoxin subunit
MAKLIKIAATKDVPLGQGAAFTVEGLRIALLQCRGNLLCNRRQLHAPWRAAVGRRSGTKVTCPWHGADFDLKTGATLGPPAQKGVPGYKVVVESDDITVKYKIL